MDSLYFINFNDMYWWWQCILDSRIQTIKWQNIYKIETALQTSSTKMYAKYSWYQLTPLVFTCLYWIWIYEFFLLGANDFYTSSSKRESPATVNTFNLRPFINSLMGMQVAYYVWIPPLAFKHEWPRIKKKSSEYRPSD